MSKNLFILMDYENFHVRPNEEYQLSVTEEGLKVLSEKLQARHGNLNRRDHMVVAAYWDDFKQQKNFFSRNFRDVIDVMKKGSNVSDGYLIVAGMQKAEIFNEDDEIVIIGNDGVYSGLINYFLYLGVKVNVYGWGTKIASALLINEDVQAYDLKELYEFNSNNHLQKGWFKPFGITVAEYAIISLAFSKDDKTLKYVATANKLYKNTTDNRYADITTYKEGMKFLDDCVSNSIFTLDRREVIGKTVPEKVLILNEENDKVKHVLSNQKVSS